MFLLSPIGRYLIMALIIAGLGAYALHEHNAFVSYKAEVAQAAKDAAVIAKQKEAENDAQTQAVARSYVDYYNKLIAGLRKQSSSNQVPKSPQGSQSSNGASSELSGACKGTEFYSNALNDALRLQMWQEWAARQHIPVGD